jgi:hypothetical protein
MELKPPEQNDRRQGLSKVAEMAVSAIPGVGGPLGVALAEALARPYNRRMQEWLTELAVALHELEERVGDFEDLSNNEAFVDAMAAGARIAERSRREKRELLRNAVLNTALAGDPDEDEQHVFFDLIDQLPPVALRLLKFLADPQFRQDLIGDDAQLPQMVRVADVASLLSRGRVGWVPGGGVVPMQAPGEDSGAVAALVDKQCVRLRDEGLLDVGALSEAGYDKDHEYFAHDVVLDRVSRFGRSFLAFVEDPRDRSTS